MKDSTIYFKIRMVAMVLFLTASLSAQVNITLNVLPPYSPYFRDYLGYATNTKTLITLLYTNPSANVPIKVFLTASIKKDDQTISAEVRDTYKPALPIDLHPNIPKTLTGTQLQTIFGNGTANDLILKGITMTDVITNQAMPEGNYSLCVKVRDYFTGNLLGEDCRTMFIAYSEPPQFTYPINNSTEFAKIPQYLMLSWSPVTPFVQGTTYRLRIVKVPMGVSNYDALNYSTQVVLEKSNIQTTNFALDLASGIKLDTGAVYAAQVTAVSKNAYIKNNGKSEPVQFLYKALPGWNNTPPIILSGGSSSIFTMLNPQKFNTGKIDTLVVNNETNMLMNWAWVKKITNDSSIVDDKNIIQQKQIEKYQLSIEKTKKLKSDKQNFVFKRDFMKDVTTKLIENSLQLTDSQALAAGFVDGGQYRATLKAYDTQNKEVGSTASVDFIFRRIANETPTFKIPVQAVVNYNFKDFPESYPVSNSEVIIDALKRQNSKTAANTASTENGFLFENLPAENIDGINYVKIASVTVQTDSLGKILTVLPVPQKYFDTDSVVYRLKIASKYYFDKHFGLIQKPVNYKDSVINFGSLTAKTFAYQLKLNVRKEFTQYNLVRNEQGLTVSLAEGTNVVQNASNELDGESQQYTYEVAKETIAEGIPVLLFRENKQSYLPAYEGNITKTNPPQKTFSKITIVGFGTTVREKDSTYVTFDRLLSTNTTDETYYIIAIKNLNEFLLNNTAKQASVSGLTANSVGNYQMTLNNSGNLTPALSEKLAGAIENMLLSPSFTNFVDSGEFVAQKVSFRLPMPQDISSENAFYRYVKSNYDIISCTPPTSRIKGRLFYTWKSDAKKLKRPLANTHFRVIVDYVDGSGKTIGATGNTSQIYAKLSGHWEYTAFQPAGSDEYIPLVDQYATMAEGTTDSQGFFSVDVVNINKKGNLGSGTLYHSEGSSKPPVAGEDVESQFKKEIESIINPGDQNFGFSQNSFGNSQFGGMHNGLNGGVNVSFNSGTQSYEIGKATKSGGAKAGGMMDFMRAPEEDKVHGPNPSMPVSPPNENTSETFSQFRRSFRIVIDGDKAQYYYPSIEVIDNIQPFQSNTTPIQITHYVKEFTIKANTFELDGNNKKIPLSDMQVTLFRDLSEKPKNLPAGEGDGEYTYAELISPVYTQTSTAKKYEQLWPSAQVEAIPGGYGKVLTGLLQSEYKKYKMQSSSYVNKGSKTYGSKIFEISDFADATTDWTNPEIPVVPIECLLSPLTSRVLVRVKDSVSGQTLTTDRGTKVLVSKTPKFEIGQMLIKPVDKYGYAELIANLDPLSKYMTEPVDSNILWFGAVATGYKITDVPFKAALRKAGDQTTPVLAIVPKGVVKGRVINADISGSSTGNINVNIVNGVPAYLQADSGKIFETDQFGNFEMEVAPKTGVKIKIIPKDVAWFDTTYILSAADAQKEIIDLKSIKVYRRKHRLQFNVTTKAQVQNIIQTLRVKNATIQLGESKVITDNYGKAQMVFENVSVNNYTFIVRGPQGQGYIPKTVNLKSVETRDFVQVNIELEKGSEISGVVKLDGKPVKNARVYLEIQNSSTAVPAINYQFDQSVSSGVANFSQGAAQQVQSNAGNYQYNPNVSPSNTPTGKITDDANLVVAFTDAYGNYVLQGVPVNNQKINVLATLDTTFTVSGDKQQANILSGKATANLNLTSYSNALVNKLWGFPLTVEKITPVTQNRIKVTGLVHCNEAITDFKFKEDIQLLRVEDVVFDITESNGNKVANASGSAIKIPGVTSLKLSYIDKYNVKLTSYNAQGLYNSVPLEITNENDFGKLTGKMQIVDNSFNYPSSYLNFAGSEFYFAKLNNDSTITNRISVATSAYSQTEANGIEFIKTEAYRKGIASKIAYFNQQPKAVYHLSNKDGQPIKFKLINFDANALPKKSYIATDGKIYLDALLTCKIPNAQPENFSVYIPGLVLDENKVYPASSTKPIAVSLEKWTLEARNWSFSTTEGGILSTNAMIRTKIVDIPVGKFVLRSDMFFMDEFKMNELSLAGGKFKLENVDPTKAHLNYEYIVGTDMKPHWNFCLLGSGNSKVASLPSLAGLPNYTIDLNYIEILSNDEMIVQLMQKNTKPFLLGNSVAKFEPLSIYNGPNYISVNGLLTTGAPRMSEIGLTAVWTDKNTNPTFENVSTDFEGKGFVHFEAVKQKISITNDLLTIEGRVLEKPDKTFNPLPATFYAHHGSGNILVPKYHVDLKKDWITQLSEVEPDGISQPKSSNSGYSLKIIEGGMKVQNNDWLTLKFEGWMMNNSKSKDDIADFKTKFEVLGDISANSDGLAITGISTPIGSMSQTFDFKKKELIGSLMINTPVQLGTVRLHSGTIETCFGMQGFYLAGGCSAFIPAGILAGDYNIGMMAGRYPLTDHLWNVTNSYVDPAVQNKCYKQSTKTLSGFYFAFNREIIKKSIDFDYILATGYVKALALIGGDFYFNITGDDWKLGGDGYVYAEAKAGLSAITGTSISGGTTTEGKIMFQLGDPGYFEAEMKMDFGAKIEQDLGLSTISKSVSVECKATAGTSGFSFSLGSGGSTLTCPPAE